MRSPRIGFRIAAIAAAVLACACSRDSNPTAPPAPQPSLANSTVTVSADSLVADNKVSTATVTVQLKDGNNAAFTQSGGQVEVFTSSGFLSAVTDHGDGTYAATLRAPNTIGRATISATLNGGALTHQFVITFIAGPPLLSLSSFGIGDTLLYADGAATTAVSLGLVDQYSNVVTTAPGPIVFATTKGSISAAAEQAGYFVATLTSPVGDATASVTVTVNGQPVPFARSAHFLTHRVWAVKSAADCCLDGSVAGAVNGIIYATGGNIFDQWGDESAVADVVAFDPATNSGTAKAAMPDVRYGHAVGALNGLLYVVGGYVNNVLTNSVITYDPASNTWSSAAPMPTARANLAVSVVGGILYAIGGDTGSSALDVVEAYDPATSSWTTRTSLPSPRSGLAAGGVNGILYALGGYPGVASTVYAYDPATNAWTSKAFMPAGGGALSAGDFGSKLYAVGGTPGVTFALYDPATDGWSLQPSMPYPASSSAVVNGSLYAVGAGGGPVLVYVP